MSGPPLPPRRLALTLGLLLVAGAFFFFFVWAHDRPEEVTNRGTPHAFLTPAQMEATHETFSFTADHLALLRSAVVEWEPSERGAPYLHRFGAKELDARIPPKELWSALEVTLQFGRLADGRYSYDNPLPAATDAETWRVDSYSDASMPVLREARVEFDLTDDHLRLLHGAQVGGPYLGLDSKRPYGDTTCFYIDMARLLELTPGGAREGCRARFTGEQVVRFDALHRSMVYALQTYLRHVALPPATFSRSPAGFGPWKRV